MSTVSKWALITGASSGLGVDFSHILARLGINLVIVARRQDRLEKLKETLKKEYNIKVEVIVMDLSNTGAGYELFDLLLLKEIRIDYLINNAGFGIYGQQVESDLSKIDEMMRLNMITLTELCHFFGKDMASRNGGRILNVASLASFQPCPGYASYAATKSYVLNFTQALGHELRDKNVTATALCPGLTETEFMEVAGQGLSIYSKFAIMKSFPVANAGIKAMFAGKQFVVPGFMNKFNVILLRLVPRSLYPKLVAYFLKE
ncbi:MAG: SDR family oxidoreductase [Bacteriovoracaceae bacterium]|nr:SDR family oxidoreductase [Bacteriovoracaceae bacterium]